MQPLPFALLPLAPTNRFNVNGQWKGAWTCAARTTLAAAPQLLEMVTITGINGGHQFIVSVFAEDAVVGRGYWVEDGTTPTFIEAIYLCEGTVYEAVSGYAHIKHINAEWVAGTFSFEVEDPQTGIQLHIGGCFDTGFSATSYTWMNPRFN